MGVVSKRLSLSSLVVVAVSVALFVTGVFSPTWRVGSDGNFTEGLLKTCLDGECQYNTLWTSNYTNPAWDPLKEGFPDFFLITQICEFAAALCILLAWLLSIILVFRSPLGLLCFYIGILSMAFGCSLMGLFTYITEYTDEPWVSVGVYGYAFILAACGTGVMMAALGLALHALRQYSLKGFDDY